MILFFIFLGKVDLFTCSFVCSFVSIFSFYLAGRALLVVFSTPFVHARPRFVCSNDPSCY